MKRQRYYIEMTLSEIRLATQALILFRNKLLEKGIDTVAVDRIIMKLCRKK